MAILDTLLAVQPDEAQAALRNHPANSLQFAENLKARHPSSFRSETTKATAR